MVALPLPGQSGGGGEPAVGLLQGQNRFVFLLPLVDRALFGKEGEEHLLAGVAVIMSAKGQLHLPIAAFM